MKKTMQYGLATLLSLALPTMVSATQFTFTVAGVDPLTVPAAPLAQPLPGMFVGLGVCSSDPLAANACTGSPAVGLNPLRTALDVQNNNVLNGTNFSNAATYGYGFQLDQVIFHQISFQFDVTNSVVSPVNATTPEQGFDFVVGSTGGGSHGNGPQGFRHDLVFGRNVRIVDANNVVYFDNTVEQEADLTIGYFEDTLNIYASPVVRVDLGSAGSMRFQLRGLGHPVTAGDPGIPIELFDLPLPSTIALMGLGLGLMGLLARRQVPGRRTALV